MMMYYLPPLSLPIYVCLSFFLTRRPIMQGQRPGGNPLFARKVFRVTCA